MFKLQLTILTIFKYYYYLPTSHKRLSRSIKFYMYLFFKISSEVLEMDDDYVNNVNVLKTTEPYI